MAFLISSTRDLAKFLSEEEAPELFDYLKLGGILRIKKEGEKLVVIYPTKNMIDSRIKELEEKRRSVLMELSKLKRMHGKKRTFDLLRIKHRILSMVDREYRELSEKLRVERLLEDERGRKIVKQLQDDRSYRERIKETIEESPVYRSSEFGVFVERTEEVKGKLLGDRIKRLEEILEKIDREMDVLKRLKSWVA